jgi:hypothetical protein
VSVDDDERLPVPIPVAAAPRVEGPESSMLIEFDGKRLRGELRRIPGSGTRFALAIVNDAPLYLLVSFRVRRGGGDVPIEPGELWLDPRSHADLIVAVPRHLALLGGRLVVRLVNARVQQELVAPLPGPAALLGAFVGAAVAGAVAAGFAFAHPRIEVFAVPSLGVANTTLQIPYRSGGFGTTSYALADDRGTTLASGALAAESGVLALTFPPSDVTRDYVVRLRKSGVLGETERAEPVTVLPPPAPPQQQLIDGLSLDTSQVSDGGSVTVRYRTGAPNGRIEIRDAQNTLWAQARIARAGVTTVQLPHFGKDKELRVTLDVERNGQHQSSSVGLDVVASAPAAAGAGSGDASGENPAAAMVSQAALGSDRAIHVSIAAGATNVHLALQRPDGSTIASQDIPSGTTSAAIPVPSGIHGSVVVVSTYDVGSGQESAVKEVDVP